jgi:hypothetical protein
MDKKKPKKLRSDGWMLFVWIGLIVVAIWALSIPIISQYQNPGTIGDMFGAVNALFSGLAFAGVIVAIKLQREELRYTRKELKYTRREIEAQKKEMQLQNATLVKQNFEDTFFSLLRLQQEAVHSLDFNYLSKDYKGRDCFSAFYKKYKNNRAGAIQNSTISADDVADYYGRIFYRQHQSDLGHYFRTLYNIIKFIDRSDIADKKLYTNLVRAQLSSYKLAFIFYNCLSFLGVEKFKALVEKYALLKNLDITLLIDPENHPSRYEPSAFGTAIPSPIRG